MKVDGACHCGFISIEGEADPEKVSICNCTDCQTSTGTAFRISVPVSGATFKMTGRRVFRMAPLHHHFEQKGWEEQTVVIRFWIIASILAIAGLATLKLR